ncbi:hypothetical protein [Curtobacterium sp. MCBD17_040]|uniref:hypothetical protein n=1 Tax=Curtobacterium sp. MCBD17_040 TaxID=2175674 RepID=UPI000DAA8D2B|nr:hypothetical protein [Curtobacterium sp. MCBD17_040]WIB65040.1 hypothetical protein DEI94_07600 [Curtobacterium sp. MCBD17_040]
MTAAQVLVWIVGPVVLLVCCVLALTSGREPRTAAGLAGVVPLAAGGLALAFHVGVPAPDPALASVMTVLMSVLGVVGGGPATAVVLRLATHRDATPGRNGGILILDQRGDGQRHEVLRGGAAIGRLERIAVVAAILVGRLEIVAAVIAIKGLGRFSELDSAEARERFIIGTLASMLWAGAFAALVALA